MGPAPRPSLHGRDPGDGSGDEGRRDSTAGGRDRQGLVRRSGGRSSGRAPARASRASSSMPSAIRAVMAGNGTIGLEILEDLPDVDAVVVPYGGGGLTCGIASALRALAPGVQGVRVRGGDRGAARRVARRRRGSRRSTYEPSFVDGIGSPEVFPEMFELTRDLVDGSLVADARRDRRRRAPARRAGTSRRRGRGRDGDRRGAGRQSRWREGCLRCLRRQHRRV